MISIQARNDLAIETVEMIDRFPFYASAVEAYRKQDGESFAHMKLASTAANSKQRRHIQSGVNPDIAAIEIALAKLGHHEQAAKSGGAYVIMGVWITIEAVVERVSQWRSRETGKKALFVGERWEEVARKRFPENAKGEFNYSKIAAAIVERSEAKMAEINRKKEQAEKKNDATFLCAELRREFNIESEYDSTFRPAKSYKSGNGYAEQAAAEGKVWMELGTKQVTPEQARIMMAALKQAGLVK